MKLNLNRAYIKELVDEPYFSRGEFYFNNGMVHIISVDLLRNKEINVKFSLWGIKTYSMCDFASLQRSNKKIFKKYEEKSSKLSFTFCRRSC